MTNSLGQVTLNSSSIFTTSAGVPVSVANASAPPKLVIQALPTMLPTGAKAGEKITIITIPANQLATLMQGNPSGLTQLIQAKPVASQLAQAATKPAATHTVQLTAGRLAPQLILAKPTTVAPSLQQLSVQFSQSHSASHKSPTQPLKPSSSQPNAAQSEAAAEAVPPSNPPAASAETSAS